MSRVRTPLLLLAPALLVAGLAGSSLPPAAAPADGDALHEHMETLSSAVKRMRKTLQDPAQRAECLEVLVEVQRAVLEAKQGTPPMAETVPEAERAAFVADYRRLIVETLQRTLTLELALLDGEQEAIDTAYRELRAMEDKGHERFTEDG